MFIWKNIGNKHLRELEIFVRKTTVGLEIQLLFILKYNCI